MDNQTTINLLPQIIEKKLELGLAGATISFKEIEISFDKSVSDIGDAISQKLCSVTTDRALKLWNAFDAESQYVLAYPDTGTFNLDLIQKLDIPGNILCKAFMAVHAKDIFALEAAPLSSQLYTQTFNALQSELLSTCKQLASKHSGHERLAEFLGSFDCEVIATIIRHEIACYCIDESGTHLSIDPNKDEKDIGDKDKNDILDEDQIGIIGEEESYDIVYKGENDDILDEEENDDMVGEDEIEMMCEKQIYLRPDWSLEETERGFRTVENDEMYYDNPELFDEPDTLREFEEAFKKGDTLPATLELTNWLQYNAPVVFSNVRNILVFHAKERGVPIWDRPNPTEEIRTDTGESAETGTKETLQTLAISGAPTDQGDDEDSTDKQSLTIARDEKEWFRLIRLYTIAHPSRKNFIAVDEKHLSSQAPTIATILVDSGMETRKLQTFEQLKNAVWNAVGFTAFKKWADQQPNSARLVESSGKKALFHEMNILDRAAFEDNLTVLHNSLEKSKYAVSKLYGWFSLVKIFWSIADKRSHFIRLASVKDDLLVWEENITCCTLIIQATIGIEKLSFSLEDLSRFCEASRKPKWSETMKKSFQTLAEENNANSAVPVFQEYIDFLSEKASNIFRIAEDIKISTEADRQRIRKVRRITEDYIELIIVQGEDPEFVKLLFRAAISKNKTITAYLEEACGYLGHRLSSYDAIALSEYLSSK